MGAYTIKTVISILLVVTGYIAGLLVIYGLRQFLPGMGIVSIFFVGSIAVQIIAFTQARTALAAPGMEHPQTTKAKIKIWSSLLWVIYILIFAVASLIPLWVAYKNEMGVPFSDQWLIWLPLYLCVAFLVCLIISIIAPFQIIKKEGLPDELNCIQKTNSRLKLICLGILAVLLVSTTAIRTATPLNTLGYLSVSEGLQFDSFEEFKAYAETPVSVDSDGNIIEIYNPDTNEVTHDEDDEWYWSDDYVEDAQGDRYPFVRRNMNIAAYDYDKETLTNFVVWSKADVNALGERIDMEALVFFLLYLGEIAAVLLVYLLKRNKLFRQYMQQV